MVSSLGRALEIGGSGISPSLSLIILGFVRFVNGDAVHAEISGDVIAVHTRNDKSLVLKNVHISFQ